MMLKDQAERAIEKHIANVKSALQNSKSSSAQISVIEQEIRDHIEEAMSESDADYEEILNGLDPPESYRNAAPDPVDPSTDYRGHLGFFVGLFFTICAFLILPIVGLPQLAPAFLIIGLIISATLGIAGCKGQFGRASILLSLAIVTFIIIMNVGEK